jgi:hypothetical protein
MRKVLRFLGKGLFRGAMFALIASPAFAQLTWNLEMRHTGVPNSCDYSVFEPELRLTNTGSVPLALNSVFVQFYFNAGPTEIEAVHPTGTLASIFTAQGGFVTADTVTVNRGQDLPNCQFAADRKANQAWRVIFDPPSAGQNLLVPPGGYATVIVQLRRAGGVSPFDQNCDDFTKVERNSPGVFASNKFFHLLFTSTQQFICERLNPTTVDPNSGISPCAPFNSACP